MINERLKALGTVAKYLGVDYMLSMMGESEIRELWVLSCDYFQNYNVLTQEKQAKLCELQERMDTFFGSHKIIRETCDKTYKLLYK